jgi:hypothetical protein
MHIHKKRLSTFGAGGFDENGSAGMITMIVAPKWPATARLSSRGFNQRIMHV